MATALAVLFPVSLLAIISRTYIPFSKYEVSTSIVKFPFGINETESNPSGISGGKTLEITPLSIEIKTGMILYCTDSSFVRQVARPFMVI